MVEIATIINDKGGNEKLNSTNSIGYHWTGHPLEDMGIAILTAFSNRNNPEEITVEDMEKFARYAEEAYFSPLISGYLTVLFTANFVNPSWKLAKKRKHVSNILRSYKIFGENSLPPCAYCNSHSIRLPYLNPDRGFLAYRDLIPLLSGEGMINFSPNGQYGLALCGRCVVGIQALAIGAPLCEGKALIVSSDNPSIVLDIVRNWLPIQRSRIQLSLASHEKPPKLNHPLTRTIEAMTKLERQTSPQYGRLILYILSNSGQGPSVKIHELPATISSFLRRVQQIKYREAWEKMVKGAWQKPSKGLSFEEDRPRLRNFLYEDLFGLPQMASRFIRIYFLRQAIRLRGSSKNNNNPATDYKGWQEAENVKWNLTEIFLSEVIGMEKERIDSIRELADRLTDDIITTNDRGLWWKAYTTQNYYGIRNLLISQSRKSLQSGKKPLVSLDQFLTVFEEGEELASSDWRLAWDLVLIRLIEQLYSKKWFEQNKEALNIDEEKGKGG